MNHTSFDQRSTTQSPDSGPSAKNILWGLTGSVASIRADRLAESLLLDREPSQVRAIVTKSAEFFEPAIPSGIKVYHDADEWHQWTTLGDPILHIELRKWADVLIIAPTSAHTLAKIAGGLCDNLLTSVARAWDFSKPFILAPAMNTLMWQHPVTTTQLNTLRDWGVHIILPVSKKLACQDIGIGALAPPESIAQSVAQHLQMNA